MEVGVDKPGGERLQGEKWWSCDLLEKDIVLHLRGVSRFYIDAEVVERDGFI